MNAHRPKLLFLSQTLPYPPDGGVKIRTYNILRLLARTFDVTALCFYRSKRGVLGTDVAGAVAGLSPHATVEAFAIPQEASRTRLILDHFRSVLTRRAYTVATYDSTAYRERLRFHLAHHKFDLVHADSLDLSGYFPEVRGLPLVCVHHDAQSALLERRARVERSAFRRSYMRLQAGLMMREERRWCPNVSLNITVSEVDRRTILTSAPSSRVEVVPNGVDTQELQPRGAAERGLVFVGGTTWFPNRDALDYFCEAILPELRRMGVDEPVTWVGRATPRERKEYRAKFGIKMTGYVDDIRPYVDRALCYVVPIRVGGGTRIKILDAWALGKAIVSTSIGCEGLSVRDGDNMLVRDDPAQFAAAVNEVVTRDALRIHLEQQGRQTVERLYSWDSLEPAMRSAYLAVAELPNGVRPERNRTHERPPKP